MQEWFDWRFPSKHSHHVVSLMLVNDSAPEYRLYWSANSNYKVLKSIHTCITRALWMFIQNASFSSCVIFLGSTFSSLLTNDLHSLDLNKWVLKGDMHFPLKKMCSKSPYLFILFLPFIKIWGAVWVLKNSSQDNWT